MCSLSPEAFNQTLRKHLEQPLQPSVPSLNWTTIPIIPDQDGVI